MDMKFELTFLVKGSVTIRQLVFLWKLLSPKAPCMWRSAGQLETPLMSLTFFSQLTLWPHLAQ